MTNNVQTPGGNTTTAGAVEMARRIASETKVGAATTDILSGMWDESPLVRAVLAAIIETTEAAARLIDHQTPTPAGGPLSHTNSMRAVMQDAARSLRNNDHLKGQP